ncbi:hypothetical protein BWK59_01270 [Flavobacterium davisii]|uniref:Glycosyltransferase family 1 protein n=1 Tax=Flavobacterium davisii TaxID=2906077 RepID=A0A2D0AIY5_9FLAO|nr:glycosyltransferase [Flavobacterium davisii]OWP85201.1 hypothetical protein BWK59_01270 [Flavobacterium davisii]
MKIIFIITDFGSFNNFLSEIAIRLSTQNEIHVITSKEKIINIQDKYDYANYNIIFHYIEFPRSFNLFNHYKASSKIHKIILKINPDIVSIHFTTAIFTSLIKSKLPIRTIGTFHGLGFPVIDNPIKKQIFKLVELFSANRLDEVWVLNNFDNEIMKNYFSNVNVIPTNGLGCDIKKFNINNFSESSRQDLRKKLKINDTDTVITFTGRYVSFKGFDIVIKTFRELEKENKNIKLLLMGGYDKIHTSGLSKEEQEYVEHNPNIINIGFTIEVDKYLSITDLFFFPSKKEGVPICIVESLSMGIPVITFNSRGCNDLINHDYNGFLMDNNSTILDFKVAFLNLLRDRKKILEYKANIDRDRNKLSRENFIKHQIHYFNNIK